MNVILIFLLTILFVITNGRNDFGIRRDIIRLSSHEKDQFLKALYKMKSIPSKYDSRYSSYDYYTLVYIHQGIQQRNGIDFLPWNRAFLYQFEQELQSFMNNKSFRLSYWDLTNKLSTFQSLYDESFLGGNGIENSINSSSKNQHLILSNSSTLSCSKWQIDIRLTETTLYKNYTCLSRNIGGNKMFDDLPNDKWWTDILDKDYNIYAHNWRQITNAIHQYIGGQQATIAAPVDPIFWFIRSWIDGIWSLYQHKYGIYYNYPTENDNANKSLFEGEYFNQTSLTAQDVLDTEMSLYYSYYFSSFSGLQIDPFPKDKEWWESDFLWAFISAAMIFAVCALICVGLAKCHRNRSRIRHLSGSSLSLIWIERYPFNTISNAEKYTL